MKNTFLYDKSGIKIGRIVDSGSRKIINDNSGIKKGSFDPRTNITYNGTGNKVGFGNLLSKLI